MQSNQNVSTTETSASPNYKKIIDKVFTCVNDHMLILIDRMLVTADEQLLDKAEKSKSDKKKQATWIVQGFFVLKKMTSADVFLST